MLIQVSISEANYEFTVRFYEFRNPLGLQCGECGSGGPPACCDDVQRNENCDNVAPHTCDTRVRFLLRPFGASVETAPTRGFPYFTPSNGGNSDTFNEGPGGFLALSNPFTITNTSKWKVSLNGYDHNPSMVHNILFPDAYIQGRIQFFIDAIDTVRQSGETEVLINRFLVNLGLELGAAFTERTTYTGIFNISGLGFIMSFRVQCSENYTSPNCATCLVPGYDPHANCTQCLTGRDANANCTTCLLPGYDPHTNCTECLTGRDVSTNCTECLVPGYDPSTDCMECLPNIQCQSTQTTTATSST